MVEININFVRLHNHWLNADAVNEAMKIYRKKLDESPDVPNVPKEISDLGTNGLFFNVLKVYYSLIYVVIEGYKELKLSDDKIDELLADDEKVQLLRRFRNRIFHF